MHQACVRALFDGYMGAWNQLLTPVGHPLLKLNHLGMQQPAGDVNRSIPSHWIHKRMSSRDQLWLLLSSASHPRIAILQMGEWLPSFQVAEGILLCLSLCQQSTRLQQLRLTLQTADGISPAPPICFQSIHDGANESFLLSCSFSQVGPKISFRWSPSVSGC